MNTVSDRWDHAISWVEDPQINSTHNRQPVFLSEYVAALEALVRSGDSGPNDLQQLRSRMGLTADLHPAVRPYKVSSIEDPGGGEITYDTPFKTHNWVGQEVSPAAHCVACGVSSNSIQAMKPCTKGASA